jgi:E3 ubiquitin-protein ligase MYCBP2
MSLNVEEVRRFLGHQGKILDKITEMSFGFEGAIQCGFCSTGFIFEPGYLSEAPKEDQLGNVLAKRHKQHYVDNRFKCPNTGCKKEQCKSCGVSPYHLGFNCHEYENLVQCRYCKQGIEHEVDYNLSPFTDICTTDESCLTKSTWACTTILSCGHRCGGLKKEKKHQLCMFKQCQSARNQDQINCIYCGDDIDSQPFAKISCGHYTHYECILNCMKIAWATKRLTFNFLRCPGCKKPLSLKPNHEAGKIYKKHLKLREKVVKLSLAKLQVERAEHEEKLADPSHRFYKKAKSYAMAIFAVYECCKCKKPFVGGKVSCEREADVNLDDGADKFICQKCANVKKCKKHGFEYMTFKCKFCCSPASWFCWGTTHFCTRCHDKQVKDKTWAKSGQHKMCIGDGSCGLGIEHPPNPSEFPLGCSACKYMK